MATTNAYYHCSNTTGLMCRYLKLIRGDATTTKQHRGVQQIQYIYICTTAAATYAYQKTAAAAVAHKVV